MSNAQRANSKISLQDIEELHNTFMLFGNPHAPYWFIGLEEGNHPLPNESVEEFAQDLARKTKRYNEKREGSLREFCGGGSDYLPNDERAAKYQPTWGGYIKLLLSLEAARQSEALPWNLGDVKHYQKYHLGELTAPTEVPMSCLGELYPLHRKGRGGSKWPYKPLAHDKSLSFFRSCRKYRERWTLERAKCLQEKIFEHCPEFVFCFGADLRHVLSRSNSGICEIQPIRELDGPAASIGYVGSTKVVFSFHPTARGIKDNYWREMGALLARTPQRQEQLKAA